MMTSLSHSHHHRHHHHHQLQLQSSQRRQHTSHAGITISRSSSSLGRSRKTNLVSSMGRTIPKVTMSSEHNNNNNNNNHETCSRRHVLLASSGSSAAFFALSAQTSSALAAPSSRPPPGYRSYRDKLDGYTFFYPSAWVPVTSAGADIFYRSTEDPEECVFVDVTSPSSSKYDSVRDLGTPREAADFVNQKLLDEFLSTRIGVRRKSDVVNANERTGADGQLYYDVAVRVRSYVDSNPLSPNPEDRQEYQEWDRTMRTTLGVSNGRLYSLRLQSRTAATDEALERASAVGKSFRAFEIEPLDE